MRCYHRLGWQLCGHGGGNEMEVLDLVVKRDMRLA